MHGQAYDQFGISRKGSEDTSDEHCNIFYDKEKVNVRPSNCDLIIYIFCILSNKMLVILYNIPLLHEGGAFRRWNFLVVRVPISSWKYVMGFWSSMHCNMGDILLKFIMHVIPLSALLFIASKVWLLILLPWQNVYTFQLKGVEPPGFSFQVVNTNMDEFSPRSRRRSALLTWQHIASLPPSLPVVYCGGFNTQKESTTGRFLLGRSRYSNELPCEPFKYCVP